MSWSESLEGEGRRQGEQKQEKWNVGQDGETESGERKKPPVWQSLGFKLICWVFAIFFFFFISYFFSSFEKDSPLSEIAEVVQPNHLTGPKHSPCCCECQSKRSACQGLPWVTPHRLVRACEMDNSLGGLSGLMTRFPGICAAVLWPGSPSKALCYGAVLPLYRYRYDRYGSTGG